MQNHRITSATLLLALLLALPAMAAAAPREGRQGSPAAPAGWSALWAEARALLTRLLPASGQAVPPAGLAATAGNPSQCDGTSGMDPNGNCHGS